MKIVYLHLIAFLFYLLILFSSLGPFNPLLSFSNLEHYEIDCKFLIF